MTDHRAAAENHIAAHRAAREHLREAYASPAGHDPRLVARLNGDLGDALKLAEVHATLAIAQQLNAIRERLVEATDLGIKATPPALLAERFGA